MAVEVPIGDDHPCTFALYYCRVFFPVPSQVPLGSFYYHLASNFDATFVHWSLQNWSWCSHEMSTFLGQASQRVAFFKKWKMNVFLSTSKELI